MSQKVKRVSRKKKRNTSRREERILLVGQQMSNLCFNLSQSDKVLTEYRQTMRELWRAWDAAKSVR